MLSIESVVEQFLDEEGWSYGRHEEHPVFHFGLTGENAQFMCYFLMDEQNEQVAAYVASPNTVPVEKRQVVAEFITRANFGLKFGNLEMDMDDGDLRAKASIDVEGGMLTTTMVRNLIGAAITTMDRYFQAMMSVIFAGVDAKIAVRNAESIASIPDEI